MYTHIEYALIEYSPLLLPPRTEHYMTFYMRCLCGEFQLVGLYQAMVI